MVPEETARKLSRDPGIPVDKLGMLVDGRYRLTRRRHVGTRSTTWRATDELQGREVALKLFDAPRAGTGAGDEDFLADAERLAALDIRGLMRVSGYGLHDDRPYLVTDAVDGEDLGQLLNLAPGTLPIEKIREIGGQIAGMLAELHRKGLLHLDLSLSAVMLRPDGRVLVTDPGLCVRRLPRIDLYSLGCLLCAMATGAAPAVAALTPREAESAVVVKSTLLPWTTLVVSDAGEHERRVRDLPRPRHGSSMARSVRDLLVYGRQMPTLSPLPWGPFGAGGKGSQVQILSSRPRGNAGRRPFSHP
ncbi:protein kinase [Streptomyces sp. NPDC056323]|uniref:protein kinase domain-containing protein n=1 Tax=Streptomyces sp. NPDC056323 TaxID=3345784 RepID=UPI0035DF43FF